MTQQTDYMRGQLEERARVMKIIIDARKLAGEVHNVAAITMADHIFDMVNGGPNEFMGS